MKLTFPQFTVVFSFYFCLLVSSPFVSLVQYVPRTLFVYITCVYTPLIKNSNADEGESQYLKNYLQNDDNIQPNPKTNESVFLFLVGEIVRLFQSKPL